MKIAILSTSLTQGGAAIVTERLARALEALGHEVKTFTLPGKREHKASFLAERLEVFACNGLNRKDLFKASTGSFGMKAPVDAVIDWRPDIAVLTWVNHGFMSLRQVSRLGSEGIPLVWVMHDMWNMTGICHYSMNCMRFILECGRCQLIRKRLQRLGDLSHRVWLRKEELYNQTPGITFVAVSRWLAEMAEKSSLLRHRDYRVIPNVFPLEKYTTGPKEKGLIILGAARLDNPIKGLDLAIDALNRLDPESGAHVAFFGDLRDPHAFDNLRLPYEYLGPLNPDEVAALCARAEVMLSTARYENLPTTLIEGQAAGCVPVSFLRGGQADIIDHGETGWLSPFDDTADIARGLQWALNANIPADKLRRSVEEKFSAATVGKAYEQLFLEILAKNH